MNYDDEDGFRHGSAGFRTCCIAGFPIGSRKTRNGRRFAPRCGMRYSRFGSLRYGFARLMVANFETANRQKTIAAAGR